MQKSVSVAATQMACTWESNDNIAQAEQLVRQAASQGAQIILLQELFETPYFCIEINLDNFTLAKTIAENPAIKHFQAIAKELAVVLPISFYELAGNVRFNTVAIIDADGEILGKYRKTHLPDTYGYMEKYYFSPGDTGFKVFASRYAKIGVGICWDQWFPECARSMALQGAELLLYPTAIGSEPKQPELDSMPHWQRVMQGHAAANQVPVIASNRIGIEASSDQETQITFFGSSFITDHSGEKVAEMSRDDPGVIVCEFDLTEISFLRSSWGIFRDRVPLAYQTLMTLDGKTA